MNDSSSSSSSGNLFSESSSKRRKLTDVKSAPEPEPERPAQAAVLAGTGYVSANEMEDSSDLLPTNSSSSASASFASLRERLRRDGYLLIRGLLPRDEVMRCRQCCIDFIRHLREFDDGDDEKTVLTVPSPDEEPVRLLDKIGLQQSDCVREVLEHDKLFWIMRGLLLYDDTDDQVATIEYKWLRAVPTSKFTGLHTDRVYMGSASEKMLTCWIPIGDIVKEQGTLLVLKGSAVDPDLEYLRSTYGRSKVGNDGVQSGWLTEDPSQLKDILVNDYQCSATPASRTCESWVVSDMKAGDVILLCMDTLHISTTNTTDQLRLSADTRWFPASQKAAFRAAKKTR